MKLKPGTLYFVRELDLLTQAVMPYCKIGLIRESNTRRVGQRVVEHQTGNPRELFAVAEVASPSIATLEAFIHARFAPLRVHGEWFDLDDNSFAAALGAASDYADAQFASLSSIERAADLGNVASCGETRPADDEVQAWHQTYLQAALLQRATDALHEQARALFESVIDAGEDVQAYAYWNEGSKPKFEENSFKESHPELHRQYVQSQEKAVGRFTPTRSSPGFTPALPGEFTDFADEFGSLCEAATSDTNRLEEVHGGYLHLLRFSAEATWDSDIAKVNLKQLCGEMDGVDGVASWRRIPKVESKFDTSAFKEGHPVLYEEFSTVTAYRSLVVRRERRYRPTRWQPTQWWA